MFTGQFVHFPGVAASRPRAAPDGLFAAGSRLESCGDLWPHHGGRDARRGSAWKALQSKTRPSSATEASIPWNWPPRAGRRLRKCARGNRLRKKKEFFAEEDRN